MSWLTNVRPVVGSVKRMGSTVAWEVSGELTSVQVAAGGATPSLNVTLYVVVSAWYIAAPLFQLEPIDGSTAVCAPADESAG